MEKSFWELLKDHNFDLKSVDGTLYDNNQIVTFKPPEGHMLETNSIYSFTDVDFLSTPIAYHYYYAWVYCIYFKPIEFTNKRVLYASGHIFYHYALNSGMDNLPFLDKAKEAFELKRDSLGA